MLKYYLSVLMTLVLSTAMRGVGPSGSLPVLYIDTENGAKIESKEDYVKATYRLDPNNADGVEALGTVDEPLELQIRGRGNYTWTGFDKKPYRLKLGKKQKMLGMNSSKHWALLAHADDNQGFLRNAVGFQLSRLTGMPWTPGDAPVEVVLNGEYIGLYFLTETVRVDSKRVDVWDYDSEYEDYADANPGQTLPWNDEYATGGWLVEIDNYDDADQVQIESIDPNVPDKTLRITYDTPSDYITQAHKDWLVNEFTSLDRMIIEGDRDECEWSKHIDLTNLARFFVVNQIVFNYESFHGSCKLSRDKGVDAKWNFGPVWDFGSAFQTRENKMLFDFGDYSNHWIKAMYEYPAFRDEVKRVYAELRDGDYDSINDYIDTFVAGIEVAAAADKERWPQYGNSNLSEKASSVKDALRGSVSYLDNEWDYRSGVVEPVNPTSELYLRGGFNNWDAQDAFKFTSEGDNRYTLRVDRLEGEWKIAGPVWNEGNVDFGGATDINLDTPVTLSFGGSNCWLADGSVADVTMIFDWETKSLIVTQNPEKFEGVDKISDDAEPEYYNLQGIRVSNPGNGVYIMRKGKSVRKVTCR